MSTNPGEVPLLERLRAATAGRYTIHAELGAGGMATVFRATEIALEREVAIKVMSPEMASSPGAAERFRREARVAAALDHPHIVPIYAIGDDPGLTYFAMKFIAGRGLDAILKAEGTQTIERMVKVVATVGRALHHAHVKGVVHRDVKPANVMIGEDGWVYVTDFGIAKRDDAQALTQAGTVIGTPAYMSPEQFNGAAVTGAADQYSLGIVAYELLAGRAPFNAPSLGEIVRGHLLELPPPLRTLRIDVPTGVAEVVHRMLEKDPAARFGTLDDAVRALEAAVGGAPRSARRASVPSTAGTPVSSVSPTTPIPRSNPALTTSGVRRTGTLPQAAPAPAAERRSLLLPLLLLLLVVGGGGYFAFRDQVDALLGIGARATVAEGAASGPGSGAAPGATGAAVPDTLGAMTDTGAAGDTTARGGTDSARVAKASAAISVDSAVQELAARLATEVAIDQLGHPDSVTVRIASQTQQTVLFVNDQQLGIIGGRGFIEASAPPGTLRIAVKKVNCRDWDTTFTALAGRRYTFVERSPTC